MKLQEIRKAKGIKAVDVADALGVSAQTVYFWESGRRTPKMANIIKLAELCGVSPVLVLAVVNGVDEQSLITKNERAAEN